ncbi:MAG: AGE family epimerase/isomerase [Sulfitobacter sp.]
MNRRFHPAEMPAQSLRRQGRQPDDPTPGAMAPTLRGWLFHTALPYWLAHGIDRRFGGFHEVLDMQGRSMLSDKRLRSMARQIYVFAKAKRMGWRGNADLAINHGLAFLANPATHSPRGWCKTFDHRGAVTDGRTDCYDHAFVLLALAECHAQGYGQADLLARRAMGALEAISCQTPGGAWNGYAEDDEGSLPRRANPHMHLLEAFLAWYELSGDAAWLARADAIVALFQGHFFSGIDLCLREELGPDLTAGPSNSRHFEPGHQFEWAWLLARHARLSNQAPPPQCHALIAQGKAFGVDAYTGLAHDLVEPSGRSLAQTARCWPQTELLKAEIELARHGMDSADIAAERSAQRLWHHFIICAPPGLWNDVAHLRRPYMESTVPASTFYHLICAISKYLEFFAPKVRPH